MLKGRTGEKRRYEMKRSEKDQGRWRGIPLKIIDAISCSGPARREVLFREKGGEVGAGGDVCVRGGGGGGGLEAGHCEVARSLTLGTARPPGAHSPTSGCEQCHRAAAAARPLSGSDLARELFGSYLANICEMSANVFLLGVHLRTCVEHTDGDVYKERGGKWIHWRSLNIWIFASWLWFGEGVRASCNIWEWVGKEYLISSSNDHCWGLPCLTVWINFPHKHPLFLPFFASIRSLHLGPNCKWVGAPDLYVDLMYPLSKSAMPSTVPKTETPMQTFWTKLRSNTELNNWIFSLANLRSD